MKKIKYIFFRYIMNNRQRCKISTDRDRFKFCVNVKN